MNLLRELLQLAEAKEQKDKKRKPKRGMLGITPITSFVAGNTVLSDSSETMSEGKKREKVIVPGTAPRNKKLNDTLRSCKGGVHYNPKHDYVRAKEKQKAHRSSLDEAT